MKEKNKGEIERALEDIDSRFFPEPMERFSSGCEAAFLRSRAECISVLQRASAYLQDTTYQNFVKYLKKNNREFKE